MNSKQMLMNEIQTNAFAAHDINLYLDIYPNNNQMINDYNKYNDKKIAATLEYEKLYGPISLDSRELNKSPWQWINEPWPWEGDL